MSFFFFFELSISNLTFSVVSSEPGDDYRCKGVLRISSMIVCLFFFFIFLKLQVLKIHIKTKNYCEINDNPQPRRDYAACDMTVGSYLDEKQKSHRLYKVQAALAVI